MNESHRYYDKQKSAYYTISFAWSSRGDKNHY